MEISEEKRRKKEDFFCRLTPILEKLPYHTVSIMCQKAKKDEKEKRKLYAVIHKRKVDETILKELQDFLIFYENTFNLPQ